MALIGILLFGSWRLALAVAIPFGLLNWFMWRKGGPAHRWRIWILERYPKKGP